MKKYIPAILGLIIGVIVSVTMISMRPVAHGAADGWHNLVAKSGSVSWESVFGTSKGKNIYFLANDKLLNAPTRDANVAIGKKYGLTPQEVESVSAGALGPILNNPRRTTPLTQENAAALANKVREDIDLMKELFTLQQEVEMAVMPSEIFSNGKLEDSGFDLLKDLDVIEEVLFLEKTENSVGGDWEGALDSPESPVQKEPLLSDFVGIGSTVDEEVTGPLVLDVTDEDTGILEVGDEEIRVNILDNDVCVEESTLGDALDDYVDDVESGLLGGGGDDGSGGSGSDDDDEGSGGDDEENAVDEKLQPAPTDEWVNEFCPGLSSGGSGAESSSTFGDEGFSSLGGVVSSVLDSSAQVEFKGGGLGAYIKLCLETEFKMKTYKSFNPGDSCVICEVNKVLENLNKTMAHSLVPNKATGNQMESAKCKDVGGLLNFQFIPISAPVPTSLNNDIIGLNNTFNEWKRFVDLNAPFLGYTESGTREDEFKLQFVSNSSQSAELLSIQATLAQRRAEALKEINSYNAVRDGENFVLYVQRTLNEMRLVNEFFKSYNTLYIKINETLFEFTQKESK